MDGVGGRRPDRRGNAEAKERGNQAGVGFQAPVDIILGDRRNARSSRNVSTTLQ
jgi:hypothetical protein